MLCVATAVGKIDTLLRAAELQDYIGENVSQLTHALQAAQLAREDGNGNDIILAALLHDIGHLCAQPGSEMMGNVGVKGHENIGARYLRTLGFSDKVAQLVEAHVLVKRYLTARDPGYYAKLSDASKTTLRYQGGPLSDEEASQFEQDPLFSLKVKMRMWDEAAKRTDWDVPSLDTYLPLITEHLTEQLKLQQSIS